MEKKYFYKMTAKRKFWYLFSKFSVIVAIILMSVLSLHLSGLKLPTVSEQLNFGLGITLIGVVGLLAVFNRIKALFKIKSMGFVVIFLILLAFRSTIDVLVYAIGLNAIPLLIDDIVITPLWNNYAFNAFED